ncbi:O-antigen polymerase [Bradyrhizobium sp. USDA 336]|uniref:O-antigen polymerase n=1 Tax=Bradyrhizobium sp. USDA 336 TaxID=3156311 RepID=UPI00384D96F2
MKSTAAFRALDRRAGVIFVLAWLFLNAVGILIPYVYIVAGNPVFLANRLGVQSYVDEALFYLLAGNASFLFGYWACSVTHAAGSFHQDDSKAYGRVFPYLLLWIFFFIATSMLLVVGGNLTQNILALLQKTRGAVEGQSFIYLLLSFLTFQSVLISLSSIRSGQNKWTALIIAMLTLILSFLCGSRVRAALCLAIPALYHAVHKGIRLKYLMLGGTLIIGILAAGAVLRSSLHTVQSSGELDEQLFSSMSLLDPTALAAAMAERLSPDPLDSLKTLILWNVPKTLVGEKELIAPVLARYMYFGDVDGGITFSLYGEFLYYFGPLVLVIACFAGGFCSRLLVQASNSDTFRGRLSFVVVSYFALSSLRNGLFIDLLAYLTIGVLAAANVAAIELSRRRR